jgi:hypothetical protein
MKTTLLRRLAPAPLSTRLLSLGMLVLGVVLLLVQGPTKVAVALFIWFGYCFFVFPGLFQCFNISPRYLPPITLCAWLHILGVAYAFNQLFYYDKVVHLTVGALLAFVVSDWFDRSAKAANPSWLVFTFLSVLGVAAFWEVSEYCGDLLFASGSQGVYDSAGQPVVSALDDSMIDMMTSGAGALIGIGIWSLLARREAGR